jgi:predicted RNase H-like HicB family nuclease
MLDRQIVVRAEWDLEAKVYVAESEDVPGLITEAETPELLSLKLKTMVPELLAELLALNASPEVESAEYLSVEVVYTTIERPRVHA